MYARVVIPIIDRDNLPLTVQQVHQTKSEIFFLEYFVGKRRTEHRLRQTAVRGLDCKWIRFLRFIFLQYVNSYGMDYVISLFIEFYC